MVWSAVGKKCDLCRSLTSGYSHHSLPCAPTSATRQCCKLTVGFSFLFYSVMNRNCRIFSTRSIAQIHPRSSPRFRDKSRNFKQPRPHWSRMNTRKQRGMRSQTHSSTLQMPPEKVSIKRRRLKDEGHGYRHDGQVTKPCTPQPTGGQHQQHMSKLLTCTAFALFSVCSFRESTNSNWKIGCRVLNRKPRNTEQGTTHPSGHSGDASLCQHLCRSW